MNKINILQYQIALSLIPGIGCVNAKNLIAYIGSVEGIFQEKENNLKKVPGIGVITAKKIAQSDVLSRAEEEVKFIEKYQLQTYFYLDEDYPYRLKRCADAPLLLYSKGNVNLNKRQMVAVVGTRNATTYGQECCDSLINAMAERSGYCVVSGLAYGIDVITHKACLKYEIPTIGVLGHGLDRLYPSLHKSTAQKMLEDGGLLTDFISETKIDRQNFLRRNRIIAGLCDATIVVESAEKGGALVTADIADSYNRDVFAFPGRASDTYSRGCNQLIKQNKATLIENLQDLEYFMSWQPEVDKPRKIQRQLFVELSHEEELITDELKEGELFIDQLCQQCQLPMGKVSSILLDLEFKGMVMSLPGKMYKLC
ncbi:DNA-processing protein DprA [Sunxiuqinia sp. A32]|uniref:DNA-processing protein DprA n=1 Tax=Sunxiuqinia sp. A32 TaxID=3461496 RepID=UPI004045572C